MTETIVFTTNLGEIVELGDEYKDMGPLNIEADYFPTALSQEFMNRDADNIVPLVEHIEPVYNYTVPTDGQQCMPMIMEADENK